MLERINISNNYYGNGLAGRLYNLKLSTPAFKGLEKDAVKLAKKAVNEVRGTSKILNPAYAEGERLVEEIFKKEGDFRTTVETLLSLFKPKEHKCYLSIIIAKVEKYLSQIGECVEPELPVELAKLKQNLAKYTKEAEGKIRTGEYSKIKFDFAKKFEKDNKPLADKIEELLNATDKRFWRASYDKPEFRDVKQPWFDLSQSGCIIFDSIEKCNLEDLSSNGIFYHGSPKPGKVLKEGFTPFTSKQLNKGARELGAGVYTTPDKKVAAFFAGLRGGIIPIKLDNNTNVAFVSEDAFIELSSIANKFIGERLPKKQIDKLPKEIKNAMFECFIRKVFLDAGYDAAYMQKAMRFGGIFNLDFLLSPDINEVIGRNQSQLVIFSPEKIKILPRTFLEKIRDIKLKIESKKNIFNFCIGKK